MRPGKPIGQERGATTQPFLKGRKKTGGRKKGTPNTTTREVKLWASAVFSDPKWRRAIMKLMLAGKAPSTTLYVLQILGGRPKSIVEVQGESAPSAGDQMAERLLEGMTPDQISAVVDDARKRMLERAAGVAEVAQDDAPV